MKAPCVYFGKCSGCTLQQYPYVKQLYEKNKRIRSELGRFVPKGRDEDSVIHPIVPSPLEFQYRTSAKLCLNQDAEGLRMIGLYERARKKVIDIPQCPVHHPQINKLVQRLFGKKAQLPEKKAQLPAPYYNHAKRSFQPQCFKFVTVRYCPDTENFGVVVSHTGVNRLELERWASGLNLTNIALYESLLTKEDQDLVLSRKVRHLAGEKLFKFALGREVFLLDPMAFFQANHSLIVPFVEHITTGLEGEELWDLYGGYGAYSFAARSRFNGIHLVETNSNAISAAKAVAKETGFTQLVASCLSAEKFLAQKLKDPKASVTHIVVNPPRSGLSHEVNAGLVDKKWSRLKRLHYVSCDVETLARDLRFLTSKGHFKVESITPFDMFPQTDHIETVVKLVR